MPNKQQIKVIIRTRPTPDFASKNLSLDQSQNTVTVSIPKDEHGGVVNNQQEAWKFKFDKIMHNASQEDLFDYCAAESVASVVDGYNGTIMCYGQTGAGKTFTMTGSTANFKYRGLIPRAISKIFSEVGGRFDTQITVKVSYVEIYNELLFDMLSGSPPHEQTGTDITVQDDSKGTVHMKGLTMVQCKSEEEALNCLFEGEQNRTIADNAVNKTSSRSHAIFAIHLESRSTIETSEKVIHSQLNLVDLAGSERTKKSGAEGLSMREAAYINKSLTYLEQVVVSTCDKKREHIPYRQCKLTNILKNSIGGNCKTILIANMFPEVPYLDETISTLRFASRMKNVTNEASINLALDQPLLIKKLEREIRDLKQELAMHDVLASKGAQDSKDEPLSSEEAYAMQTQAESFLDGDLEDIESLTSIRQVNAFLNAFRNLFRKCEHESRALLASHESIRSEKAGTAEDELKRRQTKLQEGVGEVEDLGEFGLGLAPTESKPVTKIEIGKDREAEIHAMEHFSEYSEHEDEQNHEMEETAMITRMSKTRKQNQDRRPAISKQSAFNEYKALESETGPALEAQVKENRISLKNTRNEIKAKTETCNQIKQEIDLVKDSLDQMTEKKKMERMTRLGNANNNGTAEGFLDEDQQEPDEIIDEEELNKLKNMKELKRQYRDCYNELKDFKSEAVFQQNAIDSGKTQLVNDFEQWYFETFQDANEKAAQKTSSQNMLASSGSSPNKKNLSPKRGSKAAGVAFRDPAMDDDQESSEEEREGVDVDKHAMKYIRARQNVKTLAAARKVDRT